MCCALSMYCIFRGKPNSKANTKSNLKCIAFCGSGLVSNTRTRVTNSAVPSAAAHVVCGFINTNSPHRRFFVICTRERPLYMSNCGEIRLRFRWKAAHTQTHTNMAWPPFGEHRAVCSVAWSSWPQKILPNCSVCHLSYGHTPCIVAPFDRGVWLFHLHHQFRWIARLLFFFCCCTMNAIGMDVSKVMRVKCTLHSMAEFQMKGRNN